MEDNTNEAASTPAAPSAAPPSLEHLVERWWQDHFPGSPVAQATAAWNHALAAKNELQRRLGALAGGQ